MDPRQKLEISPGGCLAPEFLTQIRIQAFQLVGIMLGKPLYIFQIFFFSDSTGAVDQGASRFHIISCLFQDLSL